MRFCAGREPLRHRNRLADISRQSLAGMPRAPFLIQHGTSTRTERPMQQHQLAQDGVAPLRLNRAALPPRTGHDATIGTHFA